MTVPENISADYTLRPSELAAVLALLVEARQPCILWGPPGSAKSMIAQQVAASASRRYVDVRALLLDPVDLRGIPWRDGADPTGCRSHTDNGNQQLTGNRTRLYDTMSVKWHR